MVDVSNQSGKQQMIHVIAKIQTQPGKRSDFLSEFHQLVPQVLEEAGCVEYGPTVDATTDIGAQQKAGDDVTVIIERWESLDALKAHLAAPHMQVYREKVKDLVKDTVLEIYEIA